MHVGRKAPVIAQKSRRGIPLHWNERFQDKREVESGMLTVMRRDYTRRYRAQANHFLRAFCGDWEDFEIAIVKQGAPPWDWL